MATGQSALPARHGPEYAAAGSYGEAGEAGSRGAERARTLLCVLGARTRARREFYGLPETDSESFGWDRAQVVSVYSLTWLASGLTAPIVGRLFDRSGPRIVYSLGLFLLGAAFLTAAYAQQLWQFRLSIGLCVGLGIAFIGNVPNSIMLGRWFGSRLPTAMSVVYSATGAGVLLLLPGSQLLIDRIGWRGAYQLFGIVALCLLVPLLLLPWRLLSGGSPHIAKKADPGFVDEGWTLLSAMRHHAFWALFGTFFFTAIAMYSITAQIVAYLIDAGFPPLQAATAWGFSGVVLVFGMLGVSALDGIIGRRPSVLFSYAVSIVGIVLLWLLQWYPNVWLLTGFVICFGSMIGSRGPLLTRDRDEDLPRRAGRHDLRHHLDRERSRLRAGLVGRRPDPRPHP